MIACGSENLISDPNSECETSDIESGAITYELSCPEMPAYPTINLSCPEIEIPTCPSINVTCPEPIVMVSAPTVTIEPAEVNVTVNGPDMSGIEAAIDDLTINMSNAVSGNNDMFLYSGTLNSYAPVQIFENNTTGHAMAQSVNGPGWTLECWIEYTNGNTVNMYTHTGQSYGLVTLDPGDSIWCQVAAAAETPASWYVLNGWWY